MRQNNFVDKFPAEMYFREDGLHSTAVDTKRAKGDYSR